MEEKIIGSSRVYYIPSPPSWRKKRTYPARDTYFSASRDSNCRIDANRRETNLPDGHKSNVRAFYVSYPNSHSAPRCTSQLLIARARNARIAKLVALRASPVSSISRVDPFLRNILEKFSPTATFPLADLTMSRAAGGRERKRVPQPILWW